MLLVWASSLLKLLLSNLCRISANLELQDLSCYYLILVASVLKLLLGNFAEFSLLGKGMGEFPTSQKFGHPPPPPRKVSPVVSIAPSPQQDFTPLLLNNNFHVII